MKNRLALIIATKDRPEELARLFDSLMAQDYAADQIIIVDGGTIPVKSLLKKYPGLIFHYLQHRPPSAAKQRNIGLQAVDSRISLIGFLDDDIVLDTGCLRAMIDFWAIAGPEVGGAALNMMNSPAVYAPRLKYSRCARELGLYSPQVGAVLPSGFQTMLSTVSTPTRVEWLGTCGSVWRKSVFDKYRFDEWFEGYSYLEDLDFSYRVGKEYELWIVDRAKYYHYPAPHGRERGYFFGKKEVLNRLYFVKKNGELSLGKFYLAIAIRMMISLSMAFKKAPANYLERATGNLVAILGQASSRHNKYPKPTDNKLIP